MYGPWSVIELCLLTQTPLNSLQDNWPHCVWNVPADILMKSNPI